MTIHDIARLAGVSAATVSRVFSHHPGIRDDIRAHVFSIARKHGYHPRIASKQKNIVIMTPCDSVLPVQMNLMALMQILPARGFRIEFLPISNMERLDSIQFCAAIAIGVEESDFPKWSERFSVPLIIVDRKLKRSCENVYSVRSDEEAGVELAIDYLYSRKCRKIGSIVRGAPGCGNSELRYNAICRALQKRNLPADDFMVYYSGDRTEKYVELIGKLLKRGIDGLFCPGRNAGIISLYALSLYGKRIPDDISFIATEQTFVSQYIVPPQTTITQDYLKIAEATADLIEDWLNNNVKSNRVVIPYKLIVRESVV